MTFKELVNKVRNLVLEAKKVTIEDTDNNFTSNNVEDALKEVFQNGVNAKNNVVTALNSKGADVTTNDTWEEIKDKIDKKEGRLDLREKILSKSSLYLVTNGTIKYIENYGGYLRALEYEEPYFYALKDTHLIKINAIDETVVFDITLANANFSCICITQEHLFISDNTKLYKINKATGSEIQSIEGAYYKLCTYGEFVYGIYGNETSSILNKIRISDMYIMLTKDMSSNGIYDFERGKFVCNNNGIYAITEHSNSNSSTDCYLSKINFDFSVAKSFRIGGQLYEKNIRFLNGFVYVSDGSTSIEVDTSKKSSFVKYDLSLNMIAYSTIPSCENFEIYNGYAYCLLTAANNYLYKLDLNTLKNVYSYNRLNFFGNSNKEMYIINNYFFSNDGVSIQRGILASKIYSQEKGEAL